MGSAFPSALHNDSSRRIVRLRHTAQYHKGMVVRLVRYLPMTYEALGSSNVKVTGAARLYRAASGLTAGLGIITGRLPDTLVEL